MLQQNLEVVKRVRWQGGSLVVTLEPRLVKAFKIDRHTFVTQEAVPDGILIRLHKLHLSGSSEATVTDGATNVAQENNDVG
jgi:hypothetical protein